MQNLNSYFCPFTYKVVEKSYLQLDDPAALGYNSHYPWILDVLVMPGNDGNFSPTQLEVSRTQTQWLDPVRLPSCSIHGTCTHVDLAKFPLI